MLDEPNPSADDHEPLPPSRGPLQGLQDMSDYLDAHPVNTGAFLRGLTIGALVGAAVAGLSIWRRLRKPPADHGDDQPA